MALKLLDRLRAAAMGWKSAGAPLPGFAMAPGVASWSQWDFELFVRDAFRGNAYGYSAISMVARSCAGVPLLVYQRGPEGLAEAAPDHALVRLLQRPSPDMSWPELCERMVICALTGGEAVGLGVGRNPVGTPPAASAPFRELWNLRPDKVKPIPGERLGQVLGYEYSSKGGKVTLSTQEVLRVLLVDPLDDLHGMPPAAPAAKAFDTSNSAQSYNKAILDNGGVPGTVFIADKDAEEPQFETEEARRKWLQQFELRHGGPNSAGRAALLRGVTPHKIGADPKDMSWDKSMDRTACMIGLVYGVAPELLGIAGQKTYSNVREARAALYRETVLPMLDKLCAGLTRWWSVFDPSVVVAYDKDDVEALQEDQGALWTRITAAWFLTVNERREALGYSPLPDGDQLLVPAGMAPYSMVALGDGGGGEL